MAAVVAVPAPAMADITPPSVIAGPSAEIAEFGGVALASDGTGGAIWRQVGDDGSHVYVARYAAGRWTAPQRVDTTLPYNSYHPRLAAAPGGHLVAMWVQDYAHRGANVLYRLSAATLRPGASRFETPWTVDGNVAVGQDALAAINPVLRLNDAGVGYVAYLVRKGAATPVNVPSYPGDIVAEFRVARYNRGLWSGLGAVNRNLGYTVPAPRDGNQPQVSVDQLGNGVVAFLEPDATGVERIWARRLFGARQGLVTRVSPFDIGGTPLNGNVDAFDLAGGGLGAATVITRQLPGRPSPLAGTRLFVTRLPNGEQSGAQRFLTPEQVNDASGRYGLPAAAMDSTQVSAVVYASGGAVLRASVGRTGPSDPTAIATSGVAGDPQVAVGPRGAGVVAYPSTASDTRGVAVVQTRPDEAELRAQLAAPVDGPVRDFRLAGSGLGDALVGFLQGEGGTTRVVVAAVQAAPQAFLVKPPISFVRPDQALLQWDRAASGVGGLVYDVAIGGRVVARGLTYPAVQLPADELDDGPNRIAVRAHDASGQAANGSPSTINIDGTAPRPTIVRQSGRRITVRLSDPLTGLRAQGAGVDPDRVFIRFGDGTQVSDEAPYTHEYKRPGRYLVRVRAADLLGNEATTDIRVRIR